MLIRFFESALSTEIASLDTTDLVGIISILKDINSIIKIDDTNYYYRYFILNTYLDTGVYKQEVQIYLDLSNIQ